MISLSLKNKKLKSNFEIINDEKGIIKLISDDPQFIIGDIKMLNAFYKEEKTIHVCSKIELKNGIDYTGMNLSNCIFHEKFVIQNGTFRGSVSFSDCTFKKELDLSQSNFPGNVRFHRSIFNESLIVVNTSFEKLVDFYYADFKKNQRFHLTDFNDTAIFSNTTFHGAVQFLHNKVASKSYISFESAVFKMGFDLSRSNFLCNLKFWGIINENTNFKQLCNNELYLFNYSQNTASKSQLAAIKKIRESFRVIKQAFRSENNNVDALDYHKLEMAALKFELGLQKNKRSERLILFFNNLSNEHGTKWIKGLWFTLGITMIFYLIGLLAISNQLSLALSVDGIGDFLKYYFQLLNITNWKYEPFGISNEPWGGPLLYISRIFISYGYYQIIQAFRKYTKN